MILLKQKFIYYKFFEFTNCHMPRVLLSINYSMQPILSKGHISLVLSLKWKGKMMTFCLVKAFISVCIKNSVYFSIINYFSILYAYFSKHSHIKLSISHYITLKYQFFLIFFILFLFFHTQ